ncbi:unnamed protein product [Calypogeia fissa]
MNLPWKKLVDDGTVILQPPSTEAHIRTGNSLNFRTAIESPNQRKSTLNAVAMSIGSSGLPAATSTGATQQQREIMLTEALKLNLSSIEQLMKLDNRSTEAPARDRVSSTIATSSSEARQAQKKLGKIEEKNPRPLKLNIEEAGNRSRKPETTLAENRTRKPETNEKFYQSNKKAQ